MNHTYSPCKSCMYGHAFIEDPSAQSWSIDCEFGNECPFQKEDGSGFDQDAFDQYHQRGKYAPKPRIVWCCEGAKTSNILDFDGKAFFLVGSEGHSDEIIEYCPWCATELRRCICK